jgi:polyisoprenoid-binding protein YceI
LRASALRIGVFALAAAIGAVRPVCAAPQRFAIDATQSSVDFRIRYLGLFSLGGRFSHVTGVVVFDPDHWESLEVAIEIPLESLESRPEFYRNELLGPHFFDRRRYPTIDFRAAGAERTGPATGEATGDLTLHGATRPVKLRARIVAMDGALEVDGETHLARSAFGLGATLPFGSDEVTVTMRIRAAVAAAP